MEVVQNSHSDDENDINLPNYSKSRKVNKIIDSDSEGENSPPNDLGGKLASASSSEDEDLPITTTKNSNMKRIGTINDDSEPPSDNEVALHNKSFPDEQTAVEAIIYSISNKGELVPESGSVAVSSKSAALASLCDAESSEDEAPNNDEMGQNAIKPIAYKPKGRRKDEPKGMNVKEAAKQRQEIRSESQRMLRETNVSLPYHKPKTFTIKEFLEKRAKLTTALPQMPKASPSMAIKMCKEQLHEISKKVDERIRQVEELFKSESEDEEEEEENVAEEIRTWLDILFDNAVDTVEKQHTEIEHPQLIEFEQPEAPKKSAVSELLQDELFSIQPKLLGGPDDVIDLDEGVTRPSEIKKLVDKFFQHTVKKHQQKHKVELNIVGISNGGKIVQETLSMDVDEEEEPVMVETPGAKLQKLREELQEKIAHKRSELWKQKQEQGEVLNVEKISDTKEKDILDDSDEEAEMTEESDFDDEEEEEDYVYIDKPQPKSAFIDEEAEDEFEKDEEIEAEGFEGDDEEAVEDSSEQSKKKVLKRILKPFTEDSDDDDQEENEIEPIVSESNLHNSTTSEDDFIPPNLPRVHQTPQRTQPDNKSEFDFLTPITYLTGLQNLNSETKIHNDSPVISPLVAASPLIASTFERQTHLQKKLFIESESSQSNLDDLADLCTGKFSATPPDLPPTTQELLNVCSGDFTTIQETQIQEKIREIEPGTKLEQDDDQIISQLLDDEDLENFRKQFESPIITKTQVEEVNATGYINSDDETEELEVKSKKRHRKLVFSDEENEDDDYASVNDENDEEIDLHDTDDEEVAMEREMQAEETGSGLKVTDFFENEAELSESEWGSADEDEKDLDQLEFEKGDEEVFDENKVRSDIERIHMRQLLDDDNREVKLLQELLLEDGEMHGTGRQRQFRWKTLDSVEFTEYERREDDGDAYLDEEESEEQWRKMRHQREMFLKKKSATEDIETILSDNAILKIGQKVLRKSQSCSNSQNNMSETDAEPAIKKEPFSLLSKRGSFLRRNDQVLQRLAEYTKVTTNQGTSVKKSKCFLFQTIQSDKTSSIKENNNKRKATEGTPQAIKKLRLSNNLSPANKQKKEKGGGAKTLFGSNW